MKLRQLNDLILECSETKKFKLGCLASILEDRMADLIVHGTIDSVEDFIKVVLDDVKKLRTWRMKDARTDSV